MGLLFSVRRHLSQPYFLPLNTSRTEFALTYLSAAYRHAKVKAGLYDEVTQLAAEYRSDKGVTIFPFHAYSEHYAKLFEQFRNQPINLLEIGLARRTDRRRLGVTCPSVSMWLDFFPRANIYGFDLDDFSDVKMPRTRIFRGDQGSKDDLLRVVEECPNFHIIIDDGSHASYHQQVTLQTLFPYLESDGIFIIEDLNWQPEELELSLPDVCKTNALLKDRSKLDEIIQGVKEVRFFDSSIQKSRGGLAAIVKQ